VTTEHFVDHQHGVKDSRVVVLLVENDLRWV
jgi:hypothetical protein